MPAGGPCPAPTDVRASAAPRAPAPEAAALAASRLAALLLPTQHLPSPLSTCFPRKLQQSFCEGKAIIFSRVLFPDECPGIHFQGRGVGEVNAHENVMSLWVFFQAAAAGGAKELVGRKE